MGAFPQLTFFSDKKIPTPKNTETPVSDNEDDLFKPLQASGEHRSLENRTLRTIL